MSRYNYLKEQWPNVPEQIWEDLEYEIARNNLEYADNYRAYNFDTGKGFKAYVKATNKGCCGFFESATKLNGEKWVIGCNYGH